MTICPLSRQPAPEPLQVVLRPFTLIGCCDRMHLEAARIERPAEPPDEAALAGGVPALEHEQRPFRRAEIGLLDDLELGLSGRSRRS